jgi:hypothetical protein
MRAEGDYYGNDSVHVQFSGTVGPSGDPRYRIATTASVPVVIEAGSGAGLTAWGWADNGWGSLGEHLRFATSGVQTVRVQRREDGFIIDQIVISPERYRDAAPGALKNDTTILPESP